jgi:hypothetical protein
MLLTFIFLLIQLSFGQNSFRYPVIITGQSLSNYGGPITTDDFRTNTKLGSLLTVSHIYAIQICWHRRPLKGIDVTYWNVSCQEYRTFEATQSPTREPVLNVDTLVLRDTSYWLGIALLNMNSTEVDSISLSFGVPNDDCPFNTVFSDLSNQCVVPTNITATAASDPLTMNKDDVLFFSFIVPPNHIGSIMAFSPTSLLVFVFRYMGTPSNTHRDGQGGSTAYLPYARPGLYNLRVRAAANITNYSFTLKFENCSGTNMTGPGCHNYYNVSNNWLDVPTRGGVPKYWQLFVPANTMASVSIGANEGDLWNYEMYVSMGQLPQPTNADISNCYGSGCQGVLSINISSMAPVDQYWYVAVIPALSNRTYGIWFDTLCAPQCEYHGVCQYGGPTIGKCNCAADFIGSGCHISNTLSAQYIVLIIIACLLFTSAIVGFIAQAYLKRKGYQNI